MAIDNTYLICVISAKTISAHRPGGKGYHIRTIFNLCRPAVSFSVGKKVRRLNRSSRGPSSGRAEGRSRERPSFEMLWRRHLHPEREPADQRPAHLTGEDNAVSRARFSFCSKASEGLTPFVRRTRVARPFQPTCSAANLEMGSQGAQSRVLGR
jgi:hypothetical protein